MENAIARCVIVRHDQGTSGQFSSEQKFLGACCFGDIDERGLVVLHGKYFCSLKDMQIWYLYLDLVICEPHIFLWPFRWALHCRQCRCQQTFGNQRHFLKGFFFCIWYEMFYIWACALKWMFISVSSLASFELTCMCEIYTYVPIFKVCPIDEGVFFGSPEGCWFFIKECKKLLKEASISNLLN